MRITKIEIKNFKAFRGPDVIDLSNKGQNLLLYGENGSGKTSLYKALELFLESREGTHQFANHQNFFSKEKGEGGYIKLHFTTDPKLEYEWPEAVPDDTKIQPIIDASKAKGFLDYKDLLKTNYLHHEQNSVNVFNLLIDTLLKNVTNDLTDPSRSFFEQWTDISEVLSSVQDATQEITALEEQLEIFNTGLKDKLNDLETRASEILRMFGYKDTVVALKFKPSRITYNHDSKELNNEQILLKVDFFGSNRPEHHKFLNEAKLSAIALSIFFAGFKLQPPSKLRILALDDVLIGLDMSNRLPVLDILDEYFSDYQIFLMTYDRAFYEMAKQRKSHDEQWKVAQLYCGEVDGYEIPLYVEDKAYLEKAREYLYAKDYKACAVYVRTAFEAAIKRYCEKKSLAIKYCENPKKLTTKDFWEVIIVEKKKSPIYPQNDIPLLDQKLVDQIKSAQKFILNPLSHANIVDIYKKELEDAIAAVERLESELARHLKTASENQQ